MLFRRRPPRDDFAVEIQAHLELESQRLIDEGLSPDEARAAARRRFGNVTSAMERFHESRHVMWFDHLLRDLRVSLRHLAKYPVACVVAVVSLAGGIGATTATLTVRDVVFRKPPVLYRAPEQLSRVQVGTPERPIRPLGSLVPGALVQIWRDAGHAGSIAAAASLGSRDVRADDRTETVPLRSVTPEFFSTLGVSAAVGRTFSDGPPDSSDTTPAVLSYRVWQTLFGGRADVVGRPLWIENRPHVVVGVLPEPFWFSSMDSPIWTLLDTAALPAMESLDVVIRRAAGVTPQRLAELLQRGLVEYASRGPARQRDLRLRVAGVEGTPLGHSVALVLPWLLGSAVFLTLLIACANVAILVIAQWTAREHEIAIRAALGGSRWRIMRLLLTESLVIALAGGLLGICATGALLGYIVRNAGPAVRFFDLSLDPAILIQSLGITIFSGIVAGLGPALLETRRLHGNPIRTIGSSDRVRQRWRHGLVVLEITVTIALLVVAVTMISSYRRSLSADLGFSTQRLLVLQVENGAGVQTARILDAVRRVPGIANAAPSTTIPYAASGPLQRVGVDAAGSRTVTAERAAIDPAFFATLGVGLRAGRIFTDHDSPQARVVIVNATLAQRLWPDGQPIGRQVWIGDTKYEVVGVVADYKNAAFQNPDWNAKLYEPFDRARKMTRVRFLARADGDALTVARALRREIPTEAAGHVVTRATTIDEVIAVGGREFLVGMAPLAPLVATGLLLTAAGLYGVLAFTITRRSKELAVRVAMGASGRDLLRLVAAHSARLVSIGALGGIGGTYVLARVMRTAGGAGSFLDPTWTAFLVPAIVIATVGVVATWIPSRRALRVDPAILLRIT